MKRKLKPKSALIPMNLIVPCSAQPRKYFDEKRMTHLCESIEKYGLIHPITVRPIGHGEYELIAGERRFRACEMAGLKEIPSIITEVDDQSAALMALSENISRDTLLFAERAKSCCDLIHNFKISRENLARELGISLSEVTLYLRYWELPIFAQKLIREYNLSDRHIAAVLQLTDPQKQIEAVQKICLGGLDVRQSLQMIKAMKENRKRIHKTRAFPADEKFFKNTLLRALDILRKNGIDADISENSLDKGTEFKILLKKQLPKTEDDALTVP